MKIRCATPDEVNILTDLAMQSKAHWGYSAEFMDACKAELAVVPTKMQSTLYHYYVAEKESEIIGFYALELLSPNEIELEALFVKPDKIGSGVGRALMSHAIDKAISIGGHILKIQGDPNAKSFYLAAGAVATGEQESLSFRGRFLPTFEVDLKSLRNS